MATFDLLKSGRHQTKKSTTRCLVSPPILCDRLAFFLRPNWLALMDQTTVSPKLSHFPQDPIDDPQRECQGPFNTALLRRWSSFFPLLLQDSSTNKVEAVLIKCLAKQLLLTNEMIVMPLSFLLLVYFFHLFLPHSLSFFPTPLPMLLCSGPKPYAPTMKAHNARVPRRPCPCTSATHACVRESKSDYGHDGTHESEKGAGTS